MLRTMPHGGGREERTEFEGLKGPENRARLSGARVLTKAPAEDFPCSGRVPG